MRISDWSSDVCSSDLPHLHAERPHLLRRSDQEADPRQGPPAAAARGPPAARRSRDHDEPGCLVRAGAAWPLELVPTERTRSEEHTSELQSLMRISYAVFCLTKKKHTASITKYNTYCIKN